jgi:hypothetical protein
VTTEDDPLADYVGPQVRRLSRQFYRAVTRLSPEGRAVLSGIPLRRKDLSAAVAALSALPRGAGAAAVGAAMASFRSSGSDAVVFLGREPGERRGGRFEPPGPCSFCDRAPSELPELRCRIVSAGAVCICEACVRAAAAASSALDASAQAHEAAVGRERCSFCGKGNVIEAPPGGGVRLLRGPRAAICDKCVALCVAIFDDNTDERDLRAESLQHWVRHLSSPKYFFRCLAAVALDDSGLASEPAAHQALLAALADTDWRVRALAEATLSKIGALPDGYRPSFVGRLRSLDFLNVVFAEHPSEIERDAPVGDSS